MAINLEEAIRKLLEFKSIIKIGTDELRGLSAGTISEEDYEADLLSLASAIEQSCGLSGAQFKSTLPPRKSPIKFCKVKTLLHI